MRATAKTTRDRIVAMIDQGMSHAEVMAETNVSNATIGRILAKHKEELSDAGRLPPTIHEICTQNGISYSTYFRRKREGKALETHFQSRDRRLIVLLGNLIRQSGSTDITTLHLLAHAKGERVSREKVKKLVSNLLRSPQAHNCQSTATSQVTCADAGCK